MSYKSQSASRFELFQRRIAPTETFNDLPDFLPESGSTYLFSATGEIRSTYLTTHVREHGANILYIDEQPDGFEINILGTVHPVSLYSIKQLDGVWSYIKSDIG